MNEFECGSVHSCILNIACVLVSMILLIIVWST